MSFFKSVLTRNNFDHHNGRYLWQYHLSENDFKELKSSIANTQSFHSLDSRDIALYYAEWWKREYNGGYPSKLDIYNSIPFTKRYFDDHDLYMLARRGILLLSIPWIQDDRTYYFRTLLNQGGLPLKHVKENEGAYKNFLKKSHGT